MNRFFPLALTAGLLSPIAAEAEFVFPWNKIEPNYSSFDFAMEACMKANKRTLNNERVKELFNKPSVQDSSFSYSVFFYFERTLLSEQCKAVRTKDPNIGRMEGSFSFLEKKYDRDGDFLEETPTVKTFSNSNFEEDIYFPFKYGKKFIFDYTKN